MVAFNYFSQNIPNFVHLVEIGWSTFPDFIPNSYKFGLNIIIKLEIFKRPVFGVKTKILKMRTETLNNRIITIRDNKTLLLIHNVPIIDFNFMDFRENRSKGIGC